MVITTNQDRRDLNTEMIVHLIRPLLQPKTLLGFTRNRGMHEPITKSMGITTINQ